MATQEPPGPPGHWLWGNLAEFRRDMLGFYARISREHGDVVAFRLGPRRLVLLNHPDHVEQVLVSENRNFVKPYIYQFLRPTLGNGLLLSEGDFWLRQRRLMQPAFSRQRVEAYGPVMVEQAQLLMSGWKDGQTRDLHGDMMQLALAIAARTLLDVDVYSDARRVGDALKCLMDDFSYRFESAFPVPRWLPTPGNRRFARALGDLDTIIHRIIQQRRASEDDPGDLLSLLIRARHEDQSNSTGMTDQQLRDEVMTLFLAGHETTANALSWTCYLLAQNREAGRLLGDELHCVLGGRLPTIADLPDLAFTEQVVLESMRVYPPVYAVSRQPLEDCTIGGMHIQAGTTLIMSQWLLHRDERWFEEPQRFNPDRWANGLIRRLPKYAYFPFGGGPRLCIGNSFAMLETILVLATIWPRFHFDLVPAHPVVPWASVTLRPAQGIQAVVRTR